MKKRILFLFCSLYALLPHASAQTFTFTNIDTIQYGPMGATLACHGTIVNATSTGFYVDALRVLNDTAPNWNTYMCLDVCYPPQVDSARVYVSANSSQAFILDFITDASLPDSSTALMKFVNPTNPSNVVYQKYYGVTQLTFGIGESAANSTAVKIFPSPLQPNSTFCFRITDSAPDRDTYSLVLYDVVGSKTSRIDGMLKGDNYLSLDLQEGIYIYNLVYGGHSVKTGKLVVGK